MISLRDRRLALSLSQSHLATILGVHRVTLVNWEQSNKPISAAIQAKLTELEASAATLPVATRTNHEGSGYIFLTLPIKNGVVNLPHGSYIRRAAHPKHMWKAIDCAPVRPGLPWYEYLYCKPPKIWFRYEADANGRPQLLDVLEGGREGATRPFTIADLAYEPRVIYVRPLTDEEQEAKWAKRIAEIGY